MAGAAKGTGGAAATSGARSRAAKSIGATYCSTPRWVLAMVATVATSPKAG